MHATANAEQDRTAEVIPPIRPQAPWRVAQVDALPEFRLRVRFNDGTEGEVDMAGLIRSPEAGVFAALRDEALFCQVGLEWGAITWPNGLDLAPDAMYEAIRQRGNWTLT